MIVPFASGAQSPNSGSHEEPPASHVGRPHPSHPSSAAGLRLTVTDRSADVLPERVRPKGRAYGGARRRAYGEGPPKRTTTSRPLTA